MSTEQTQEPEQKPTPDPNAPLLEELAQLRTWKAQKEVEEGRAREAARLAEQQRLAQAGEIDKLVRQHAHDLDQERARMRETVERHKQAEKARELALALSRHRLVKGAADQLARLWADEFEVVEQGDAFQVRSKDLRSPADFVSARLAADEFAHFVQAESRGGGGSIQGQTRTPTGQPETRAKVSLAEALVARMQQTMPDLPGYSPGMGLRGRR